jgi:hypothetical protein
MAAVKKLKSLVTFVNKSPQTSAKLANCQKKINPTARTLKLLCDVKTRWWSTHTMVEQALKLRPAIEMMFRDEIVNRTSPGKPTPLEGLALQPIDYVTLEHIVQVLAPFREAQLALEGEKYVNLSLLVIIIHELRTILEGLIAAVDPNDEPDLYDLLHKMADDFKDRWGDPILYRRDVARIQSRRMEGIPPFAYWAALLDPRTKIKSTKVLSPRERTIIWKDIQDYIFSIEDARDDSDEVPVMVPASNNAGSTGRKKAKRKGAASFIMNATANEESEDDAEILSVRATISMELAMFQKDKGCALCDADGRYQCPLLWWKMNHTKYPHVWEVAKRVLSIPATSAPSERLFSAASNLINKKRAALSPQNADMLLFLKANKDLIQW